MHTLSLGASRTGTAFKVLPRRRGGDYCNSLLPSFFCRQQIGWSPAGFKFSPQAVTQFVSFRICLLQQILNTDCDSMDLVNEAVLAAAYHLLRTIVNCCLVTRQACNISCMHNSSARCTRTIDLLLHVVAWSVQEFARGATLVGVRRLIRQVVVQTDQACIKSMLKLHRSAVHGKPFSTTVMLMNLVPTIRLATCIWCACVTSSENYIEVQ